MITDKQRLLGVHERKRYLRTKLFHNQNGKCYLCHTPMLLAINGGRPKNEPDNMACLARRKLPDPGQPEFTDPRDKLMCVLCRGCMVARDRERTLKIPLQDRQLASGRMPLSIPPDGQAPDLLNPPESIG